MTNTNKTLFKKIAIGNKFHTGIDQPSYPYKDNRVMVYERINGHSAVCIDQTGYGNTRAVGGYYSFAPNTTVFEI